MLEHSPTVKVNEDTLLVALPSGDSLEAKQEPPEAAAPPTSTPNSEPGSGLGA